MSLRRIAYVVNVFPKLSETFIIGELVELRRRGLDVCILSNRRPSESLRHRIVDEAGLLQRVVYVPDEFTNRLRAFRPHIIHAHFATEPAACARQLARELDVPFTFTAHGYDIYRRPPEDFAERAAAADAVVTVSQANARYLVESFGVQPSHLQIIPCGVDTDLFRPATNNVYHERSADSSPLLVCVARLVPVKNLELLLQACAELRARNVAFRCVIVGDGKSRDKLLAEHARLRLDDKVEFVGAAEQTAVLGWWQRARIAVLTSQREGMPVSLMEAAACGVPAVATAVGGVPELVADGITGLLVPPGNCKALAIALERLLTNGDLAIQMGIRARQRVEQRFSIRRQVEQLIDLWSGLVRTEAQLCQLR
jgi:colanic acid/amylovoran biosynthesis glycosyltransferase